MRRLIGRLFDGVAGGLSRPLSSAELSAPAIVFAPHPDDEVLGCGGLIARKAEVGASVTVVFMTDGRASHRRFMDESELVARRRAEGLAACAVLGVPAGNVQFLDFPDQELHAHHGAAVARVRTLLAEHPDHQVIMPYHRDITGDHVVTNAVVMEALGGTGGRPGVLGFAVWYWSEWPYMPAAAAGLRSRLRLVLRGVWRWLERCRELRAHADVASVLDRKRAALDEHRTQVTRLDGQDDWPILADVAGGEWLARFFSGREYFHRVTAR